MKKLSVIISVIAVLAAFQSCTYTEDYLYDPHYLVEDPNPLYDTIDPIGQNGQMRASINGTTWSSDTVWAVITDNRIDITGTTSSGTQMLLKIQGTTIQDYELGQAISRAYYTEGGLTYFDNLGSIILEEIDDDNKTITGTFYFDASESGGDSRTITNGHFTDVQYFGDLFNNSFSVDIDSSGTLWTPDVVSAERTGGKIIISGSNSTGSQSIEIQLLETSSAPANYDLDSIITPNAKYIVSGTTYVAKTGTVGVYIHNFSTNEIEGSFFFSAGQMGSPVVEHTLSEGTFAVKYIE